jgi:hypothetical protein
MEEDFVVITGKEEESQSRKKSPSEDSSILEPNPKRIAISPSTPL